MRILSRQRGISGWGVMLLLIILGFIGLIGLKLFPIYTESFSIDGAMKGVVESPEVTKWKKREIYIALIKRFDIEDVSSIPERHIKDYVTITKKNGKVALDIVYRRETKLFGNVSLAVDFVKHAEN